MAAVNTDEAKQEQNQDTENTDLTEEEERTTWPPPEPLHDSQDAADEASGLPNNTHEADCSAITTTTVNARDAEEEQSTAGGTLNTRVAGTPPRPHSMEQTIVADTSVGVAETTEEATSDSKMAKVSPESSDAAYLVIRPEEEEEEEEEVSQMQTPSKSVGVADESTVFYKVIEFKAGAQSDSGDSEGDSEGDGENEGEDDGEDEGASEEDATVSAGASPYVMIGGMPHSPRGRGPTETEGLTLVHGGNVKVGQDVVALGSPGSNMDFEQPCSIDPTVLKDVERLAFKAAGNLDHMMMNLRNGLYAMTVCMRQMSEIHNEAFGNMQKTVDVSTKSMYSFLAKFEELNSSLESLKELSKQISDISETLKTLERQFRT